MPIETKRILILCKTYPTPSATYSELSCVAGIDDEGKMIRLFPVPFRLISDDAQFKKWQWITAKVKKAPKDHRPESYTISVDAIVCDAAAIPTKNHWALRRPIIGHIPSFHDFVTLDTSRQTSGGTIGLLRPARIIRLDIRQVSNPAWTSEEIGKLEQHQKQAGLFDAEEAKSIRQLRKLPFDFYYVYECDTQAGAVQYTHKIVDWEIGALYWRCAREYGSKWEEQFRKTIESKLPSQDLMFLMGTIHRFPNQWLIISLIYPPKRVDTGQTELLL